MSAHPTGTLYSYAASLANTVEMFNGLSEGKRFDYAKMIEPNVSRIDTPPRHVQSPQPATAHENE